LLSQLRNGVSDIDGVSLEKWAEFCPKSLVHYEVDRAPKKVLEEKL
jgi:hypothetical protein